MSIICKERTCFKVYTSGVDGFSYIYNSLKGVCLTKYFREVKVTTFNAISTVGGDFDTEDEAKRFLDIYNNCNNIEQVKVDLCGQF